MTKGSFNLRLELFASLAAREGFSDRPLDLRASGVERLLAVARSFVESICRVGSRGRAPRR